MKRTDQSTPTANTGGNIGTNVKNNGQTGAHVEIAEVDLSVLLACLQTMRDGDFSVRLPGNWTGLAGKIADTFNDIVAANQQMAWELKRVGQVVGKEGRTRERMRFPARRKRHGERWKCRSIRSWTTCSGPPPKSRAPSRPWPRAT